VIAGVDGLNITLSLLPVDHHHSKVYIWFGGGGGSLSAWQEITSGQLTINIFNVQHETWHIRNLILFPYGEIW
jgi:hypothetical protein